jgi:DNA polymerase elongation subunit (family B)
MLIFDVECYKNYFLVSFLNDYGKVAHVEMRGDGKLDVAKLSRFMKTNTTIGFNSNCYDIYMIAGALENRSCAELKAMSQEIIMSKLPPWRAVDVAIPRDWDTIDIIEVLPGQASLKIYGARINQPKLQDLPYPHDATLTDTQMDAVRDYCVNDLRVTKALADKIAPQIALRVDMGAQYGLDLRSKSDAQIAEAVLKSEIEAISGKTLRPLVVRDGETVRYTDPGIVSFNDPGLTDIFERICAHDFELLGNGSIKMPDWLADTKIKIGSGSYQMGIGGLHSTEKAQSVRAGDGYFLCDFDVASYYPNIILQQAVEPVNMTGHFLQVYQSILDRRLVAKRTGDKVTNETLKIVVNGSFGKLGSKWSILYAPNLLIQTTITGQLCLLMLIEAYEAAGARVVSANTDGVVVLAPKALEGTIAQVNWDWQMATSYELERTDYAALHSRDVNNYIAVKLDGSTKGKGVFGGAAISKNPDFPIVAGAMADYLCGKADFRDVIRQCDDITKFVTVRKVTGGAEWRGDTLGKSVRFYYSTDAAQDEAITYIKSGNKVPKSDGAKPLMGLPDVMPNDVDLERYVGMAMIALKGMGCA